MLGVSDAFTALSFILVAVLTVRMLVTLRRAEKQRTAEAILLTVLAVTLVIIIANKTLSPQYIVWLGGPVAALQVLRTSRWLRPHAWGLAVGLLVVAVLTQATYPWNYGAIRAGQLPATLILVSRNLLVVVIFCYTTGLAWVAARRPMARPVRRPEEAVAAA